MSVRQEKDAEAGEDPEKQKLDAGDDVEDGLEKVELNEVTVDPEVRSFFIAKTHLRHNFGA